MLSDGNAVYTYSDRGRMASATVGASVVTYKYNALEQRLSKLGPTAVVPTGAAYYAYDEAGRLIGEYDANMLPISETVYFGDTPVAVLKHSTVTAKGKTTWTTAVSYIYVDHLNTPRVITRSTDQAIQWRWDQAEPYGATPPNQNPSGLGVFVFNQRFPGQVFDAETGNFQNWHREYNPRTGRYVQSDPIGLAGGINTYAYVGGNPISYVDPRGLDNPSMGPYGPYPSSMGFRRGTPGYSCTCMVDFSTYYPPPGTNFSEVHRAGQNNGWNPRDVNRNVGHWGTFDFQRDAGMNQFTRAYTDAANFGVGVYMHGAGYSRANTTRIAGGFAGIFSSNAGDPNQVKYWQTGWDAANSGNLEYVCQ